VARDRTHEHGREPDRRGRAQRDATRGPLILQEVGVVDLGTKSRPWPLGESGWEMPGAPSTDWRKYRYGPLEQVPPG
jgi:hypothetical protein